jgi:transcriptional regulator with XRE-family HTH domain
MPTTLRGLREERGLGLDQLARRLGINSSGPLSLIERGRRRPTLAIARGLAAEYGISTQAVFLLAYEAEEEYRREIARQELARVLSGASRLSRREPNDQPSAE